MIVHSSKNYSLYMSWCIKCWFWSFKQLFEFVIIGLTYLSLSISINSGETVWHYS